MPAWTVELDDGSGFDRGCKIQERPEVGTVIHHAHGRTWVVDRVSADSWSAHAVPADDDARHARAPTG